MRTSHHASIPVRTPSHPLLSLAHEPESPWAARGLTDLVPPATLAEARAHRQELTRLLRQERQAAADFLLALADFDRRRGWERLGHASLFSFLTRELGLSKGAAYLRFTAARLLPGHPAVEAALRGGRLCLSAIGELARVLTPENEPQVLPRFLGCSSREAREVAAALMPCPDPPRRDVVTSPSPRPAPLALASPEVPPDAAPASAPGPVAQAAPHCEAVRAHELTPACPAREAAAAVEPLTADLRRLHMTVTRGFLDKVSKARDGLSHALPGATTEQVLEAALDLLLEKQARRKALVKRPRPSTSPSFAPSSATSSASVLAPASARRPPVPAALEREVRLRDGDRCQYPLDAGGVCGSTWQVELDHLVPVVLDGPTSAANLRCACRVHNAYAAGLELGQSLMESCRRPCDTAWDD